MIWLASTRRIALSLVLVVALGGIVVLLNRRAPRGAAGSTAHPTAEPSWGLDSNAAPRQRFRIDERRRQLIGVRTTRVVRDSLEKTIGAAGVVRYDESRLVDVNLKVEGWLRDVFVNYVGQPVRSGQPLIAVFSPELEALQANLLGAIRARDQTPVAQSADGLEYASRLVDTPRQRLRQLDVAEEELHTIERSGRPSSTVVFRSPMNGVIVEQNVVKGMHAAAGEMLYRIADLSVVFVDAEFRETDVTALMPGAQTEISVDALPGEQIVGHIVNTYPFLSEHTRTLKARIELRNSSGRLKPGMYASVTLKAAAQQGLIVPADSIVDSGIRQIVFVTDGDGYFEPRRVRIGARGDGEVVVLEGLKENEEIATRATFFLDSESQMRAALQDYDAPSLPGSAASSSESVTLALHLQNPARLGENVLQVTVKDREGRPVVDVDVSARLSMPPMPSMNMPAMESTTPLPHVNDGLYRGSATASMAGRWNLTVDARRDGRLMGRSETALLVP